MTLPVAILAGGLATRLGPRTQNIPKSLLEVAGKPFIFHQLESLRRSKIDQVVLCVGHLGESIQQVVGDGRAIGMKIDYSFDGKKLLGTGGALRQALSLLGQSFFVLYGDSYLPIDYQMVEKAFCQSKRLGLMTVYHNQGQLDRSNVLFADNRIVRYDKKNPSSDMQHIDYGLGVLTSNALDSVPLDQHCELADVYTDLVEREQMAGFEVSQRFYEIGSVAGLEETNRFLLEKK